MKLELKAYKCVFPNLFTEAYNQYMWQDPKQYEVIFGKTQREAVKNKCLNQDCYSYFELKQNINTRRFSEKDLYSQEKHNLLLNLSDKHIHHLTHSLGVEIGDFDPDDFYRNYSVYRNKKELCEELVKLGLMENYKKFESEVYRVTQLGEEATRTLLLTYKK